jgi:hypothetical protein
MDTRQRTPLRAQLRPAGTKPATPAAAKPFWPAGAGLRAPERKAADRALDHLTFDVEFKLDPARTRP